MSYQLAVNRLVSEHGAEHSTMMKTPCLRFRGQFLGMMFEKENALIIKVSPQRVEELITKGVGLEFNFTRKKFKEWVLIPLAYENSYEDFLLEALQYSKKSPQ